MRLPGFYASVCGSTITTAHVVTPVEYVIGRIGKFIHRVGHIDAAAVKARQHYAVGVAVGQAAVGHHKVGAVGRGHAAASRPHDDGRALRHPVIQVLRRGAADVHRTVRRTLIVQIGVDRLHDWPRIAVIGQQVGRVAHERFVRVGGPILGLLRQILFSHRHLVHREAQIIQHDGGRRDLAAVGQFRVLKDVAHIQPDRFLPAGFVLRGLRWGLPCFPAPGCRVRQVGGDICGRRGVLCAGRSLYGRRGLRRTGRFFCGRRRSREPSRQHPLRRGGQFVPCLPRFDGQLPSGVLQPCQRGLHAVAARQQQPQTGQRNQRRLPYFVHVLSPHSPLPPERGVCAGGPPLGRTKGKTARSCFYRGTANRRGWLGVSAAALPFPVVYKKRIALFYGKCKKTRRKKSRRALLFLRKPVIFGEAASKMPYPAVSHALQALRSRAVYQRFTTSLYSPS